MDFLPPLKVRFGDEPCVHIRLRGGGKLTVVNRISTMVFLNIGIGDE